MRSWSRGQIALTVLTVAFVCGPAAALRAWAADSNPVVSLPFASTIAPLSKAPLPVYLPSWLPALPSGIRAFASIVATPNSAAPDGYTATYEADLVLGAHPPCRTCDVISVRGSTNPYPHTSRTRRVAIVPGIPGYFTTYANGQWFTWRIGHHYYGLRCSLPDPPHYALHACSLAQDLRIVRSVVWVN